MKSLPTSTVLSRDLICPRQELIFIVFALRPGFLFNLYFPDTRVFMSDVIGSFHAVSVP